MEQNASSRNQIAILDFGSQYTHLISRAIRSLGVFTAIYPNAVKARKISKNTAGIILSGGPNSVYDNTVLPYDPAIFDLRIPILGLCYGHQLMGQHFGGLVKGGKVKEYGKTELTRIVSSVIFHNIPIKTTVWMSHGDNVAKLPPQFNAIAKTSDCPAAAMEWKEKRIFGFQFHPEVKHTKHGTQILSNFIFKICQAKKKWNTEHILHELEKSIKARVKNKKVFLLVSGGVDSTVSFALLERCLGKERVYGLHIDNGFLRKNESADVGKYLKKAGFYNLHICDASDLFLSRLKNVTNPEKKRKLIGKLFLDVAQKEAQKLGLNEEHWVIGQGTIYPDTIESGGTRASHVIKTHHNRIQKIQELIARGKIIEPIADFYKDEVRVIGRELGISQAILDRHPFPGPGLAIRALCGKTPFISGTKNIEIKRFAQKFLTNQLNYRKNFDIAILPLHTTGVQGDQRSYAHPALLKGITNWKVAGALSTALTNKFKEVNRIATLLYPLNLDLKKIQFKEARLTKERLALLRTADDLVTKKLQKLKLYKKIWQCPVILAPLTLGEGECVILRPIESEEAMTANFYKMQSQDLKRIAADLIKINGIDMIFYDVTNKPPATIEWE